MAAELRLILLGLGAALVVGLWWWERRRSDVPRQETPPRNTALLEPRIGSDGEAPMSAIPPADAGPIALTTEMDTQEMPARRAPVLDRPVPRGDPPVVTIDNLPEDAIDVVLEAPELSPPVLMSASPPRPMAAARDAPDQRRRVVDPPII